jgi:hypothetical protein
MEALDISAVDVALDSIPAARSTADYQMMWRAAKGNAHFWCYRAAEKPIHLAHLRNQADMWRALDGRQRLDLMPLMTPRAIKPSEPPFETIALDLGIAGDSALFLPANYNVAADGAVELTIHFHGATWFVIQEHQRRGNGDPIVALELGQGSSVYAKPFEDPLLFRRLLDAVAEELKKRGGPPETHIDSVNITSFSAGYGAVREIVKSPEHVALLKRIVLADSSYGSLNESHLAQDKRVVASEHVEPWLEIARLAQGGGKTLLMMTSDIAPDTYAGTHEVARAVAEALQLEIKPIPADSCPAAESGLAYPLHTRADSGGFHWWAYGGNDAVVHMTIARHIADAWETLDQLGDP